MTIPGLGLPNLRVSTQENKGASAFERFDGASRCLARRKADQDMNMVRHNFRFLDYDFVILGHPP